MFGFAGNTAKIFTSAIWTIKLWNVHFQKAKIAKNLEIFSLEMNALAIPFDLSPHKPYFGWKKNFGFFSRDLVIFGFFWIFKFQLEIPFSDCMGSTRYSFRPFWANKRGEKKFFSNFLPFLLNRKFFFKIRSFEFWIKNYAPKFIRWLLEVDLEASFVL